MKYQKSGEPYRLRDKVRNNDFSSDCKQINFYRAKAFRTPSTNDPDTAISISMSSKESKEPKLSVTSRILMPNCSGHRTLGLEHVG